MISFRALAADEVEARVGVCNGNGVSLLLYKDSRVDMKLLDETVGPMGWQCDYWSIDGKLFCKVGICMEDGVWVWKADTGTPSNMEAQKGEASDAFKRACTKWGIGRELYTAPFVWVPASKCSIEQGRNGKPQCRDEFRVSAMEVEDGAITGLRIRNMKRGGEIVFEFPAGDGGKEPGKPRQERQDAAGGRFAKARALRAEAVELGVSEDGISGWVAAHMGAKPMREYTDAEVAILEGYLSTLVRDKRSLDGRA